MRAAMSSPEWQPTQLPEWLGPAAAWLASVVAAGGAKPVWDWWQGRGREQREAKKLEIDAATELREELRQTVREMRTDLAERDGKIDAVQREMFELLGKVASLTAENQILRASDHRLRAWLAGFYATLQMRWRQAGLPPEDFPPIPEWVNQSPDGPTASFREPSP